MLAVQTYLQTHSLEDLKTTYGIKYRINTDLNVVCLNYDMLNSDMSQVIVQECRSLILDTHTFNVLSFPFKRFFNYGEGHIPADFDWNNFGTAKKIDGSLISLYYTTDGRRQFSTRSVPDANCCYDEGTHTFKELIEGVIFEMTNGEPEKFYKSFHPGFSYAFELTTPENQVVIKYDTRKLTLLAIRDISNLLELDVEEWAYWMNYKYPVDIPEKGLTFEQVKTKVAAIDPLKEEGFVLVDNNFNRIKIKSEAYLLLSHSRDGLGKSAKTRLEIILMDKLDDVKSLQPEWVQKKLEDMVEALVITSTTIDNKYTEIQYLPTQKDFALVAKEYPYFDALFSIRKGQVENSLDWLRKTGLRNPKSILELLKKVNPTLDTEVEEE